jgi:succinoglycan biosynthesis protein ExoM
MRPDALVSICICTYKRPSQLEHLLHRLSEQAGVSQILEVVVVDNDHLGSGRQAVDAAMAGGLPFDLRYEIQPEKNIALSRNRSVGLATGKWIAFIDDDELPSRRWIQLMVRTALDHRAQGTMGPVIALVPPIAPEWIRQGHFYDRRRFVTGTEVPRQEYRCGNALCNADWLRRIPGPFDPALGLTGGEDGHMFNRLANLGARFVW